MKLKGRGGAERRERLQLIKQEDLLGTFEKREGFLKRTFEKKDLQLEKGDLQPRGGRPLRS